MQTLLQGLRGHGYSAGLVRPHQPEETPLPDPQLLLAASAPIPRYSGLRFGFPVGDDAAFVAALVAQAERGDLREAGLRGRDAVLHLHPELICGQFARLLSQLQDRSNVA